jgi:DnaJ-class molecular chaperone
MRCSACNGSGKILQIDGMYDACVVCGGTASDFDKNKLFKLDEESAQLRSELAGI